MNKSMTTFAYAARAADMKNIKSALNDVRVKGKKVFTQVKTIKKDGCVSFDDHTGRQVLWAARHSNGTYLVRTLPGLLSVA